MLPRLSNILQAKEGIHSWLSSCRATPSSSCLRRKATAVMPSTGVRWVKINILISQIKGRMDRFHPRTNWCSGVPRREGSRGTRCRSWSCSPAREFAQGSCSREYQRESAPPSFSNWRTDPGPGHPAWPLPGPLWKRLPVWYLPTTKKKGRSQTLNPQKISSLRLNEVTSCLKGPLSPPGNYLSGAKCHSGRRGSAFKK